MRGVAVAAVAGIALVLGLAAWTAPPTGSKPALRLLDSSPLAVKGSSFRAGERVQVVTSTGALVRVRAGSRGGFVARFPTVLVDPCNGVVVNALGSRGSRASFKLPARQCPPALAGDPDTAPSRPSLEIVGIDPLAVRGSGFRPAERVRLELDDHTSAIVKWVRAGQRGRFTTLVRGLTACNGLTVEAAGMRGSRTSLSLDWLLC